MSYFVVFLFVSSSCFFISSFLSRFFDLSFHVKGLSGSVDEEDGGYWLFLVSVCVCVFTLKNLPSISAERFDQLLRALICFLLP